MSACFRLFQLKHSSANNHFATMINEATQLLLDVHNLGDLFFYCFLRSDEFGSIRIKFGSLNIFGQVISNGIRKDEITVGQTLHQSRST